MEDIDNVKVLLLGTIVQNFWDKEGWASSYKRKFLNNYEFKAIKEIACPLYAIGFYVRDYSNYNIKLLKVTDKKCDDPNNICFKFEPVKTMAIESEYLYKNVSCIDAHKILSIDNNYEIYNALRNLWDSSLNVILDPPSNVLSNTNLKIFMASSTGKKDHLEQIGMILNELKCEAVPWYGNNSFPLSEFTLESLIKMCDNCQKAIIYFSEDDKIQDDSGRQVGVPRDNVVFECGLFVGKMGRENVAIIKENSNVKLPSDIAGLTYLPSDFSGSNRFVFKNNLKNWIECKK
ncbi:nucleotide-binding protein [Desulfosporosinus sp. FKB]|uniref:TIR domain-containing protein n=1 Tax=Desulfosporosinus sp. FKB TaxID=1969835 RepID=UPI000B49DEEF|nr:nucleotide-binding protein [Desulfosporosinus sp. FKB]